MINDTATSSHPSADAGDIVTVPKTDAPIDETLMPDPVGTDVGPLPPIDAAPSGPSSDDGAIDGVPGRYERQEEEDAAGGLDMTPAPLGASNG